MKWEKKEIPPELVKRLAQRYGCDTLTAAILARRGILRGEEIQFYLESDLRYLHNPFLFPGMEDAVDRILSAGEEQEKVLVFGDRDVDGITSTALLVRQLQRMGLSVEWRVPLGNDAYGLSREMVQQWAEQGGTLIITVDCGISNHEEIALAQELGIDVIVVDHHNPQDELPPALAIINPKLKDTPYPFRDLAGCGVTYKLVWALRFARKSSLYGQNLCLLTTRPTNDAFEVEVAILRNLVVVRRLTETIIPGMVTIEQTRILPLIQDTPILVWDRPLHVRNFHKMFGSGIEPYFQDMGEEIGREFPQVAGKSLLRLKELSRIARYTEGNPTELDTFINLFVTYIQKKENLYTEEDQEDLQLVALGTIADMMPLQNENRIIVKNGISAMEKKARPGISDLFFKLGLSGRPIIASDLSWQVCPAINASGRMGRPDLAVELLLEEKLPRREELVQAVLQMNEDRRKLGNDIWAVVEPMAAASLEQFGGKLVVAFGPEIHRGVTGIMAARMVQRFKVPAIAVAFTSETTLSGSLRSTRGYDVRSLLEQCADLFTDWGGHDYAAGFTMDHEKWPLFLDRLKIVSACMELEEAQDEEILHIDAELPHGYLTPELLKVVDTFEPYGEANDHLFFLARGLPIIDILLMGKNGTPHVKLTVDAGAYKWPAVYWQAAEKVKTEFDLHDRVDLVFRLQRNWFNGTETPQLIITDLKRSEVAHEKKQVS